MWSKGKVNQRPSTGPLYSRKTSEFNSSARSPCSNADHSFDVEHRMKTATSSPYHFSSLNVQEHALSHPVVISALASAGEDVQLAAMRSSNIPDEGRILICNSVRRGMLPSKVHGSSCSTAIVAFLPAHQEGPPEQRTSDPPTTDSRGNQ